MLTFLNIYTPIQLILSYFLIYNLTLLIFLYLNTIILIFNQKTLYSFNNLSLTSYYLFLITILLFSIAGVPPFLGFFSKVIILIITFINNFFLLYYILFLVLFIGLYFYMQNIRFIHSTFIKSLFSPYLYNEKLIIIFYYSSIYWLLILILGLITFDDINFYILWLFN